MQDKRLMYQVKSKAIIAGIFNWSDLIQQPKFFLFNIFDKGPFKYYVIKEVVDWGQKMAILDDLGGWA